MLAMEVQAPRGVRQPVSSLTTIASMPQAGARSYRVHVDRLVNVHLKNHVSSASVSLSLKFTRGQLV